VRSIVLAVAAFVTLVPLAAAQKTVSPPLQVAPVAAPSQPPVPSAGEFSRPQGSPNPTQANNPPIPMAAEAAQSGAVAARDSADAARRGADTAERALITRERAFVYPAGFRFVSHMNPSNSTFWWSVHQIWRNSGRTPTKDLVVNVNRYIETGRSQLSSPSRRVPKDPIYRPRSAPICP